MFMQEMPSPEFLEKRMKDIYLDMITTRNEGITVVSRKEKGQESLCDATQRFLSPFCRQIPLRQFCIITLRLR